jgi:hypothetical protein
MVRFFGNIYFKFQEDLSKVQKSAFQTMELCDKFRRKNFLESFFKMWKTPDYDKYEESKS